MIFIDKQLSIDYAYGPKHRTEKRSDAAAPAQLRL